MVMAMGAMRGDGPRRTLRGRRMLDSYSAMARRAGLILALALVGYAAITHAVGMSLAGADPDLSLAISPDNARALGERSQRIFTTARDRLSRTQATELGRRALALDATVIPAIVTLALNAGVEGSSDRAARLMTYAQALSRRDGTTQLYFIEDAVARGDVVEALRHYDTVLRTSDTAPALLFPILRNAIAEAPLRHALAATLRKRPAWAEHFVLESSAYGPDFHAVALLFAEVRGAGFEPPSNADNALISNLLAKNDLQTAWRYYKIMHPDADPSTVRDGEFKGSRTTGTPFDWVLSTDDGISTSMGVDGQNGGLEFSTTPTNAGVIARQMLVLSPGTYRLSTVATGIAQDRGSGPYWELVCLDGKIAGSLEIGPARESKAMFAQTIVVPLNCPGQWLQLRARASDNIKGATGQILAVSVERRQ